MYGRDVPVSLHNIWMWLKSTFPFPTSYKTVLLSDIKLQRVGERLLPMPRTANPHDKPSYPKW